MLTTNHNILNTITTPSNEIISKTSDLIYIKNESQTESELFTSIINNINCLESSNYISNKSALIQKFLINRMKNYHSKINYKDYNVVQSSKFLFYIPPKCRKYFTNIAYHQEITDNSGSLTSLWSWYSGKDSESGISSYIYIVSHESFSKMNDNFKIFKLSILKLNLQIDNLNKCQESNSDIDPDIELKIHNLKSQIQSKMEEYVALVFNNLSFFDTLNDAKKKVISLSNRFVIFRDPRNSRHLSGKFNLPNRKENKIEDVNNENGWTRDILSLDINEM